MATNLTKENRVTSLSRPSSIKLPPLPAVNYPHHYHQVRTKMNMCAFLLLTLNYILILCLDISLNEHIRMTSLLTIEKPDRIFFIEMNWRDLSNEFENGVGSINTY
jgi:hypothetical protein